jgi:hypothetical protein
MDEVSRLLLRLLSLAALEVGNRIADEIDAFIDVVGP